MADSDRTPTSIVPIDGMKMFNEFQSQSRARMEATIKLVIIISGGMLTLSVGAILGKVPPKITADLVPVLIWGWSLLFYSIAASMLLMGLMIIATFHMGLRMKKVLENEKPGVVIIATWTWLRVLNATLGISILISCVAGIALMACVALGVVNETATQSSTPISHPALPKATNP